MVARTQKPGWFPKVPRKRVRNWRGGKLRIVRVLDPGLDFEWRESLGRFEAEPFGEGLALLPRCVPVTDQKGTLLVEIEVGVVNGQPGVRAIHARGVAVTAMLLRTQLPSLPRLVRDVAREATVKLARTPEGEVVGERYVEMPTQHIRTPEGEIRGAAWSKLEEAESLGAGRDEVDAELEAMLARRRRRTLDGDFLYRVAEVYREALAKGTSTQKEIQRRLGPISDAGARRWVQRAREAGYLGKAHGPWKAGERSDAESPKPKQRRKGENRG